MIVNSNNYTDFVSVAKCLKTLDGVFYNTSATMSGQVGTAVWAICSREDAIGIQYFLGNTTAPAATITADFPGAVAVSGLITLS
jgi:hypothetical protein